MGNILQSIDLGFQKLNQFYDLQSPIVKIIIFVAGIALVYGLAALVLGPIYSAGKDFGRYFYNTLFQ